MLTTTTTRCDSRFFAFGPSAGGGGWLTPRARETELCGSGCFAALLSSPHTPLHLAHLWLVLIRIRQTATPANSNGGGKQQRATRTSHRDFESRIAQHNSVGQSSLIFESCISKHPSFEQHRSESNHFDFPLSTSTPTDPLSDSYSGHIYTHNPLPPLSHLHVHHRRRSSTENQVTLE